MARYKMSPTTARWTFVNKLLDERQMNQTELGKHLGVCQHNVCNMLRFTSRPTFLTLISLSELFDVTIDELVRSYAAENPKWQLD